MLKYSKQALKTISINDSEIFSFLSDKESNIDINTVNSFGEEWASFNQFDDKEIKFIGNEYFDIINESHINNDSIVLDVGCGSGRWTKYISSKVKFVEAIDPSNAIFAAHNLLKDVKNARITHAGVDSIPFEDNAFDLVFSLGVLHHIPDTLKAMQSCVDKIKPGGVFLVYLYYSLDNRGVFYRLLFFITNFFRRIISMLPSTVKKIICDIIAVLVYYPLATLSKLLKYVSKGKFYSKIPLSYYHDKSFYVMRNDALDRFGTPLEQRFSKLEIETMMKSCGLKNIIFSNNAPYWHVIGIK